MDEVLSELIDSHSTRDGTDLKTDVRIRFTKGGMTQIKFDGDDETEPYTLKPLDQLYGRGNPGSPDPQNLAFMPLFTAIESEIVKFDEEAEGLTDAHVILSLNAMGMNLEKPSSDPLIQWLQGALQLTLSLNNYSRQEVRQAIRRVGRSVERHQESGRGRGYLNFIRQYV